MRSHKIEIEWKPRDGCRWQLEEKKMTIEDMIQSGWMIGVWYGWLGGDDL
jgi:hypothetical protein